MVEKSFLKNGRTVYQVDYCDLEKDKEFNEELERKRHVKLPDDWIIPDTTYLNSYRNPTLFKKNALERKTYGKQPDNLGSKGKKKILTELFNISCENNLLIFITFSLRTYFQNT